jgi:hypothetical protein
VGFLVNSLFHETKIPTVDMKVHVCSKFWKNLFWEKVKSPLSMNFGRVNTSKCMGKLQKMGCSTPNPPKKPRPLLHASAINLFFKRNKKKTKKKTPCLFVQVNTELGNHALGGINMHLSSLD